MNRPARILAAACVFALVPEQPAAEAQDDRGHGGHGYAPPALDELGGAISMTDQDGHPFTDDRYLGHYSLVYAGYMECLEACPIGIGTIRAAAAELSDEGIETEAVFIDIRAPRLDDRSGGMHAHGEHRAAMTDHSVHDLKVTGPDVRRAALADWTEQIGGGMVTLSGNRKQTGDAVRSFRVRAEANMARNGEPGTRLNHTTHVYLIGPAGAVEALFYHDTPVEEIVGAVTALAD